jgi:hypothetical protein
MAARWKLGKALAGVTRAQGNNQYGSRAETTKRSYRDFLTSLRLDLKLALHAQRIGAMPDEEMARAFQQARSEARLLHYGELTAGATMAQAVCIVCPSMLDVSSALVRFEIFAEKKNGARPERFPENIFWKIERGWGRGRIELI